MQRKQAAVRRERSARRKVLSVALGVALVSPGLAWAQGYVGFGAGQSSLVDEGDVAPGGNIDDADMGWKLFGGYSFHPNLAVEFGYLDLGQFDGEGGLTGSWEATGINVSALGVWPLANQFSLLGKIGATRWDVDNNLGGLSASDNGTDLSYGIGAQYDFTPQIAGRFEWERFGDVGDEGSTGQSDLDLLSASIAYRF